MVSAAIARSPRRRVGIISDTHGLLRPEALRALRGSDCIVHAGDIGDPRILEALATIAPVTAVRGNNDRDAWAAHLPNVAHVEVARVRLLVIHDLAELPGVAAAGRIDVVVSGHSHRPAIERRDGVLFVNPGSAGPRRFRLPVAVAMVEIAADRIDAVGIALDVAPTASARTRAR
jgi:putative phosphoesterase